MTPILPEILTSCPYNCWPLLLRMSVVHPFGTSGFFGPVSVKYKFLSFFLLELGIFGAVFDIFDIFSIVFTVKKILKFAVTFRFEFFLLEVF